MIVMSPKAHAGFKSSKAYSHRSYLATVEDMLGLPRLATVATQAPMTDSFAP